MSKIEQALSRLFEQHRIVFWYDTQRELREDYESVQLDGVTKREVSGDAFGVKHHILREQPEGRFLLYFHGPQPEDLDNWLLDVQLSQGVFRASQTSIITSELNLPPELAATVEAHIVFYDAKARVEALARLLTKDETSEALTRKMIAACVGIREPAVEPILEALLAELATGEEEKIRLIGRCALDTPLWSMVQARYAYESDSPSIRDFALSLFKSGYIQGVEHVGTLSDQALVFLRRWKDSIRHQSSFEALSDSSAHELGIEQDLTQRSVRDLIGVDLFRLIDQRILSELVQDVASRRLDLKECLRIIHERRFGHWFGEYEHLYGATEVAAQLLYGIEAADLRIESMEDGFDKYASAWFRFDQLYRQFVFHCRKAGRITLVQELAEQVENIYTNRFLLDVNDRWQQMVDRSSPWEVQGVSPQRDFYKRWVGPFPAQDKKVFVIISDALRYEVADELLIRIRQEDRYEAKLEAMLGSLPSTTQIGMAALLPHDKLTISMDANAEILVDGLNPAGTIARAKILEHALPGQATAIQAEAFLQMDREQARDLTRSHQVVYIYHSQIDDVGHTEKRVFEAVDETFETLILIIKKLAAANASNLLITADHGFLYQDRALDDSDFAAEVKDSGDATYRGRRFIVGKDLPEHSSLRKFQASELGLSGDLEIQIPKSINRLRLQGAGSRFVHGGASLQEIVLPVLSINKKRKSDVREVNVDILAGESSVITSGQLSVKFYQTEPVTEKVQPRKLRAGIFTTEGALISDQHELVFDHASDSAREREKVVRFILSREADSANNQPVELRLEENVQGTTHYRIYRKATYQLRRSFTTDFDF